MGVALRAVLPLRWQQEWRDAEGAWERCLCRMVPLLLLRVLALWHCLGPPPPPPLRVLASCCIMNRSGAVAAGLPCRETAAAAIAAQPNALCVPAPPPRPQRGAATRWRLSCLPRRSRRSRRRQGRRPRRPRRRCVGFRGSPPRGVQVRLHREALPVAATEPCALTCTSGPCPHPPPGAGQEGQRCRGRPPRRRAGPCCGCGSKWRRPRCSRPTGGC